MNRHRLAGIPGGGRDVTTLPGEPLRMALAGLLVEYRNRRILAPSFEAKGMERHAGALAEQWNARFPGFPTEHFPYTSLRGEFHRKQRDAHLKDIIVRLLADCDGPPPIVNPACVFGAHACDLARRLPHRQVIGTDIDPRWHALYRIRKLGHLPRNFSFRQDNIFSPQLDVTPIAVVFFGACGSVTDGALDYAIAAGARFVMCRTCCHDNIGGNLAVTSRPSLVSHFFRAKNRVYNRLKKAPKYSGYYFSQKYADNAYPRSVAGRRSSTPDEFLAVARDSAESDICRAIIDLDRCLYLVEHGFLVEYQGELLVAEREV